MELNVLMIDDHQPIIEGYKAILSFNPQGYIVNATAANCCEEAFRIITTSKTQYDVVLVDLTMPPYPEENLHSGEDLVPLIKSYFPKAKIMMLTSHSQSLLLYRLLKNCDPDGLLVKSDFTVRDFLTAFDIIVRGEPFYTSTVINLKKEMNKTQKIWDNYNRQILMLLAEGVQTKSLPDYLNLSKSAIDKRKAIIKEFFGVEKGTDEDIIRAARKQGLI